MVAYDPQIFPDIFVWVRCPPDGLHVRVVLEHNMTVAEIIQSARAFVAATYEHPSAILEGIYHLTNRAGYDLEPQWTMIDYDFINGDILRLGYTEPDRVDEGNASCHWLEEEAGEEEEEEKRRYLFLRFVRNFKEISKNKNLRNL